MIIALILSFIQIGLFSFGGGYAAIPLIQGQIVDLHHWLSMAEFTDLITISQMTPGPIAINAATFVGLKIFGVLGSLAATVGCVLPSCIIVTVIAKVYLKYRDMAFLQIVLKVLRPAVIAMIASAGISILITAFFNGGIISADISNIKFDMIAIFILCVALLKKTRLNPILIMIMAGVLKVISGYWL